MDRRGAPGILFLRAGGLWPEWTSFLLLARQDTRRGLSWPAWPNHTSAQPEEAGPEKGAGSYLLSPLEILTFLILLILIKAKPNSSLSLVSQINLLKSSYT